MRKAWTLAIPWRGSKLPQHKAQAEVTLRRALKGRRKLAGGERSAAPG